MVVDIHSVTGEGELSSKYLKFYAPCHLNLRFHRVADVWPSNDPGDDFASGSAVWAIAVKISKTPDVCFFEV